MPAFVFNLLIRTPVKSGIICLLGGVLGATVSLSGQGADQAIIDRAEQPRFEPGRPGGETDVRGARVDGPVSAEDDLGVQRVVETRRFPWRFSSYLDLRAYYTNDVFLNKTNRDASILATTASIRADTHSSVVAGGLLSAGVGINFQRFLHSRDSAVLDFDSYAVPLGLRYRRPGGWEAGLTVTPGWLYRRNGYDQIYRSVQSGLSLRKITPLRETTLLVLGGGVSYIDTHADNAGGLFRKDRNDRIEAAIDAAIYEQFGSWTVSLYGRVAYADYRHYEAAGLPPQPLNRNDWTVNLNASVSYSFTEQLSARIFTSFDWRDSNVADNSYGANSVGVGASFVARF